MDLDRGTQARLDRRLLAGLDRDERFQMVRVPVTPAKWSTWKRYCDTAGISMGRAFAALIDYELVWVFGDRSNGAMSMFEAQAQRQLADREATLTKREHELDAAEERMRRWSEHLRGWEHEIEVREGESRQRRRCRLSPPRSAPRPTATNAARADPASSTSTATVYRAGSSERPS